MGPVLVLGNDRKAGVADAVAEVRPRLEKDFGVAAVDLKGDLDIGSAEAAWCLVFGGDGAMLNAARRMATDPIPTLEPLGSTLPYSSQSVGLGLEDCYRVCRIGIIPSPID